MEFAIKDFQHAYKQLVFAFRLKSYCEQGHMNIDKFDSANLEITGNNITFRAGNFKTQEDIVICSNINVIVSFGVLAIQLDSAFDAAGIKRRPKSNDLKDVTRSIVRMVRCAFAHNMANPKWDARDEYLKTFELDLGNKFVSLDMTSLNGREFDYSHIGDLSDWNKICKLSLGIMQEHQNQKAKLPQSQ